MTAANAIALEYQIDLNNNVDKLNELAADLQTKAVDLHRHLDFFARKINDVVTKIQKPKFVLDDMEKDGLSDLSGKIKKYLPTWRSHKGSSTCKHKCDAKIEALAAIVHVVTKIEGDLEKIEQAIKLNLA